MEGWMVESISFTLAFIIYKIKMEATQNVPVDQFVFLIDNRQETRLVRIKDNK